jgi:hypothetical protein
MLRPVHGNGTYESPHWVARYGIGRGQAPTLAMAAKAVRDDSRGSQQGQVSVRIQRFIYASQGRRRSSELDLLVGGMDRWTG